MGERHDYVALEWVKGEIAETLKQARQSLEDHVSQEQGNAGLRFCLAYIHQVHGILQMVEFFGAALLAEEMELLAKSLLDDTVASANEALEVLMQAIIQLPLYLERIQSARRDLPMVVLPLLNDLRAARGEKFLSQSSLFNLRLPQDLPPLSEERLQRLAGPQLLAVLRKIRQTMQVALIGLLRDPSSSDSLTQLARVFAALEKLSWGAPSFPLWQAAAGLIDGLANRSLSVSTSVRSLLRQLDRQLRELVKEGATGLNRPAAGELLKNILFYVAKAEPNSERLKYLHQTYGLLDAMPVDTADDQTTDRETIRSVVVALCEELVRIKDSLDLFVRNSDSSPDELHSLQSPLKQIADTLAVLGFAQQRKVVLEQGEILQTIASGDAAARDARLLDVAGALLYLEATLVGMVGSTAAHNTGTEEVAPTDMAQLHRMVIREARTGLEEAKDGIIEFIASQWEHRHLEPVSVLLKQVRGGLTMIPLPRAAQLIDSTRRYIDEKLLAPLAVPGWQDLDTLADAITSVDYYLERLYDDHASDNELILDTAAASMAALGYPLAEPEPEPADSAVAEHTAETEQQIADVPDEQTATATLEVEPPVLSLQPDTDLPAETETAPWPSNSAENAEFAEPEHVVLGSDEPEELLFESFELPEIELPKEAIQPEQESSEEAHHTVLTAAVSPLNPPAVHVLESLLPPPADEEPVDAELQEVFVEEAGEVLETLAEYFPRWQQDPTDDKALAEVRRAFHTLKGSGRMVRALVAGELAWAIENLLNRVIEGSVEAGREVQDVIARVLGLLPELIEEYATGRQRQRDDVDRQAAIAHALARQQPVPVFAEEEAELEPASQEQTASDGATQETPAEQLDPVLVEIFHSEATGHLQVLQDFVIQCKEFLPRTISEDLQRAMHTLKGSVHMAGITPLIELATAAERLVKEYRAHQFHIDEPAAALLARSAELAQQGLEQLTSSPLAPLAGASELIGELNRLLDERLSCELRPVTQAADPLLISRFLAEGMDLLLEMEDHLQQWRTHPADQEQLLELIEELAALQEGAHMAGIEPIVALGSALSAFYSHVYDGRQQLDDDTFSQVSTAHEALISMMDEVAAGLDVTPQPQLVEGLQSLLVSVPPHDAESVAATQTTEITDVSSDSTARPDSAMVEIFLDEALDLLASANQNLEQWLAAPDSSHYLTILMRDAHTLKGGAQMAEITAAGNLAHELEQTYEGLLDGRYSGSNELNDLLLAAHAELAALCEQLQAGTALQQPQDIIRRLQNYRQSAVMPSAAPVAETGAGNTVSQTESLLPAAQPAVTKPVQVQADPDNELTEIFLEEAFEVLETMAAGLQNWLSDRDNLVHVEGLQRDLHTLKGGARMAEMTEVADLAHELEFLYEDLTSGRMQFAEGLDTFLYQAHDQMNDMLEAVRDQRPVVSADALLESARRWRQGQPESEAPEQVVLASVPSVQPAALAETSDAEPAQLFAPALQAETADDGVRQTLPFMQQAVDSAPLRGPQQGPQEQVRIPAGLLEGLVNLAGETSIFRGRVEQQVSDFGFTLSEMETTLDRIRDQLRRLDTENQAQILSRLQTEGEGTDYAEFDPLEMDRHSQLQQLSRSLFESASDLLDLKETLVAKSRDAETLLLQQARVNTELQEGLMRTRMVPFERMVPRLRRVVRQVATELGKQVELQVANAEGEMDRSVMERLVAPLEHMLRNAVDHGLELPDARKAAGKPETGLIRLELAREGADILLSLSDDGVGINVESVRNKAIAQGLMSAQSDLSDQEVIQFIFHAGFSTAEQVTQLSGRGVGMDVVSAELKQLGGAINIEFQPGKGTRFLIRLPFTVSVNRALMVMTGEDLYAVPLNTIEGIVRVSPYELQALYEQQRMGEPAYYEYAGQEYDLQYLGDLLANGQQPKLVGQTLPMPVILVRSSEHAVAVQVDSLAGSREIVVKGLGPQFASVPSLSGATILGDGRVVVILDLLAAIRSRYGLLELAGAVQPSLLLQQGDAGPERALHVMVVDDSVTVRKVTSRLLERYGMRVTTAKDGVDAINQLQEHRPDIMLLDIEMPRMDGFEVATLVRHDEQLRDLPIIMITSRTGEKHRERALAIGVNDYIGKPYQEAHLLEQIRLLTGRAP